VNALLPGRGVFCEPENDWGEHGWHWRERVLRTAAVWPCTGRRCVSIAAFQQAKFVNVPDYNPACSLHLEHLHPAQRMAYTSTCGCSFRTECGVRKAVARFPYACA
jgi:hypothetical protein